VFDDVWYDEPKREALRDAFAAWLRRWHAATRTDGRPFAARRAAMHAVNPWFVLRNYIAQEAIDAATRGDLSLVHTLLDVLRDPYTTPPDHASSPSARFAARRPEWARTKAGCSMLSCSS